MISQIDHLGVLVADIDANVDLFELLGLSVGAIEHVDAFGVDIAFIRVGESLVELVEPVDDTSPLAGDLRAADRPAFLHHIAFRVDDIEAELTSLMAHGVPLVDEEPRPGAGDARVAFLDPQAANGVSVELVERSQPVTVD